MQCRSLWNIHNKLNTITSQRIIGRQHPNKGLLDDNSKAAWKISVEVVTQPEWIQGYGSKNGCFRDRKLSLSPGKVQVEQGREVPPTWWREMQKSFPVTFLVPECHVMSKLVAFAWPNTWSLGVKTGMHLNKLSHAFIEEKTMNSGVVLVSSCPHFFFMLATLFSLI